MCTRKVSARFREQLGNLEHLNSESAQLPLLDRVRWFYQWYRESAGNACQFSTSRYRGPFQLSHWDGPTASIHYRKMARQGKHSHRSRYQAERSRVLRNNHHEIDYLKWLLLSSIGRTCHTMKGVPQNLHGVEASQSESSKRHDRI